MNDSRTADGEESTPQVRRAAAVVNRIRAFHLLLIVDGVLVVLHLLSQVVTVNGDTLIPSHDVVNLNREVSLPTWWQQSQLLAAAVLCLLLAAARRRSPPRGDDSFWFGLGAVFILLSLDEGAAMHETLIGPTQRAFEISGGYLLSAWVIPALVAVLAFAVVFARFWWGLPAGPRWTIAFGGAVFVFGAVGLEMIAADYASNNGVDELWWFFVAIEEGLEMLGATMFILSVMTMIKLEQPEEGVLLRVEDS